MAPLRVAEDRLTSGHRLSHAPPGDEVLITGVSGYFPDSDSVMQLQENLFNKVDLVTSDERRWNLLNPELPDRTGKINNLDKFDATFFGIDYKEAYTMDPMGRILMEKAYEAIFDAGMNPNELRGSKMGVFVGITMSESEETWVRKKMQFNGFGLTGYSRAMLANRISFWLGVTGPSYTLDTACSSSLYALDHAFRAIREGRCDSAIVCASNLCLLPYTTLQFARYGFLSNDGRSKCFDNNANGYVRSEAVVALLLQKAKNSRRAHAQLLYTSTSCDGFKEQGIFHPSEEMQKYFFKEFYEECSISPHSLEFFEVHGTGTTVGDLAELQSVDEIFCKGRSSPLKIGSVKSNMGHTEPACGLCAIVKMCIAYSTGYIPPNLHYNTPRKDVEALAKHRFLVVTDKTPWQRGLTGVNGFGFGGSNGHVLLKNFARDKVNNSIPSDDLPRLVCVSGRTESAVARILNDLESRTLDVDYVRLLHSIYDMDIEGHSVRGYSLLGSTPTKCISLYRNVQYFSGVRRPVWFVYSDMDPECASMATELMRIPVFAAAIKKCHNVLEPKGINLTATITEKDRTFYDNNLNCFIGTVAVHIGLTDVLKTVGVEPNKTIGYGVGELGCAYANGSVTAEETILSAYDRGVDTRRSLAKESTPTVNIGRDQDLFPSEETISHIHQDIISIEITPNRSLQNTPVSSINSAFNITLLEKNSEDSVLVLLNALGILYEVGLNLHLANIYPEVPFPVSQGTPMLAHLVEWEHSDNWSVAFFKKQSNEKYGKRTVNISLADESHEYLASKRNLDGPILYPATGYLVLVWETLGMMMGTTYTEVSVVFENVCFLKPTNFSKEGNLEFTITIHKESGDFEVAESGVSTVTGRIYPKDNFDKNYELQRPAKSTTPNKQLFRVLAKDFYKEMRLREYQPSGLFMSIQEWDMHRSRGRITWANNWVTFLDGMLQLQIISCDTRGLIVPTRIEKVSIDVHKHYNFTSKINPKSTDGYLEAQMYQSNEMIRSGGVEIRALHGKVINKRPEHERVPILEKSEFVPNIGQVQRKIDDVLKIYIQIILENTLIFKVKGIEFADDEYKINNYKPLLATVKNILGDLPLVWAELLLISDGHLEMSEHVTVANKTLNGESKNTMFIGANLLKRPDVLEQALSAIRDKCFIISRETECPDQQKFSDKYNIVCVYNTGDEYLVLFKKWVKPRPTKYIRIVTSDQTYAWIEEVKNALKYNQKLVLYNQCEPHNGLLGFVKCLRKELGSDTISALLIADPTTPSFNPDFDFYKEQLNKDLAFNIYQDGQWGTYQYFHLEHLETVQVNHAYVNTVTNGDLSSLRWLEGNLRENHVFKNPDHILVHVYCAALNFRDVMTATSRLSLDALARGRLAQECVQGVEIAGKTPDGARVMGIVNHSGLANLAVGFKPMLMPVPDAWSFEEAATIPVAYSTAYYAMVMIGRIQRDESILIHAGSGGVGQAAINVALHYGCEVFTTVGTAEKRAFIKKLFPQLKDSHIGNSRNTSFEEMIKRETNGKGVDLVLNSLSDDKLQASIRCLGSLGRFLEIGKFDISKNTPIAMDYFNKEVSFHSIMLDMTDACEYKQIQRLQKLILDGITTGVVRPLTYCTFENNEIEDAYRYMGAGKHIGKVIIKIREEDRSNLSVKPTSMLIEATPRYNCSEDHVYVIVGGLGGFGLELTDWLILRGARKIVLSSRRGVVNGYQTYRLGVWTSYGANIQISTDDVTTETGCEALLKAANDLGPIEAIFNLACILKDAIFQNQTPETFRISFEPKGKTTIHLDKLSKKLCPELKDFVVFSSISCGRGITGQTNYGFSNSVMEKICEERKRIGLPARVIQWGAIGDVGVVADNMHKQKEIEGTRHQKISSCLQALDKLMKQDAVIVSSFVVGEKKTGGANVGNIAETIAQIMGIEDLKTVSRLVTLAELGLDSITAVEIKQKLEHEFEISLTPHDIRTITFPKLLDMNAAKEAPKAGTNQLVTEVVKPSASLKSFVNYVGDENKAS